MKFGEYILDLYCDNDGSRHRGKIEFPQTYTSEYGSICRRRAREDGWILGEKDLCPICSGVKPRKLYVRSK